MGVIKTNYGLERKRNNPAESVNVKDLEQELLKHVGGSFVYVKTKKFFVEEEVSGN